jgi:hypothetical protein
MGSGQNHRPPVDETKHYRFQISPTMICWKKMTKRRSINGSSMEDKRKETYREATGNKSSDDFNHRTQSTHDEIAIEQQQTNDPRNPGDDR